MTTALTRRYEALGSERALVPHRRKDKTEERSVGKLHAAFDEAGAGNGATSATAPALDPNCEGFGVKLLGASHRGLKSSMTVL